MPNIMITNYALALSRKPKPAEVARDKELIAKAQQIVSENAMPKGYIMVIEAAHTGVPTLKYIAYSSKGMEESVKTLYQPVWRPLKLNHKSADYNSPFFDKNDIAIGRIVFAEFRKGKKEVNHGVADGTVVAVAYVPESATLPNGERVVDAIIDRRIINVSIAATFSRDTAKCSICGKNPFTTGDSEDACTHHRGSTYDGKVCYYTLSDPMFEEISLVVDPADPSAFISTVAVTDSAHDSLSDTTFVSEDACVGSLALYTADGRVYTKDTAESDSTNMDEETAMTTQNTPQEVKDAVTDAASLTRLVHTIASLAERVLELSAQVATLQNAAEAESESVDDADQENPAEEEVLTDNLPEAAEEPESVEKPDEMQADSSGGESSEAPASVEEPAESTPEISDSSGNPHTSDTATDAMGIRAYVRSRKLSKSVERNERVLFKIKR